MLLLCITAVAKIAVVTGVCGAVVYTVAVAVVSIVVVAVVVAALVVSAAAVLY